MIATGSLSAFSTSVLQSLPSQVGRADAGDLAVQQARATQVPPQVQPPPSVALEPAKSAPQPTGRPLPRGSLLDLSV